MISSFPSRYVTRNEPLNTYPQWSHWQRSLGSPLNGDSSGGNCPGMDSKAIRILPASTWRPWYSPMIVGAKSSLDTCMEDSPFVGGCGGHRDAAAAVG